MNDPLKRLATAAVGEDPAAKPQSFGQLTIERRVLVTPRSTINIMNIASIEVRSWTERKSPSPLLVFALAFVAALIIGGIVSAGAGPRNSGAGLIPGGLTFFAMLFILTKLMAKEEHFNRLIIATNDGSRTYFPANEVTILEKVRRVLSDKINAGDENATYTINFEKAEIESLNIGSVSSIDTLVSGSGNQIAKSGGRIGTTETTISNSPGTVTGSGHVVSGNTYNVNYAGYMPAIAEMRRTYAADPQYDYVVKRLDQLETLMRTGTPTQDSKGVMRDLLKDLAQIFGAIPDAMTIFRGIAKLAGFSI